MTNFQELLQRVLAIEKKVGINYTPTQPKEEINKPKEQAPAIAKPKFEEKKTIQSKWPPKKDDSDSDEGKASDKKAVKFVPESTKKKEESQRNVPYFNCIMNFCISAVTENRNSTRSSHISTEYLNLIGIANE